jgi:hypothetical protein
LWIDALPILAGGLLVTGIVVGYFASKGALADFWDQAIVYNFLYANDRTGVDRFSALLSGMNQLVNVGLAPLALTGWGAAFLLLLFKHERFSLEARPLLWMAIIALPLDLWLVSLGGRPRVPYFMTLLPTFALFACVTIWLIFDSLLKDIPNYAGAALTVLMVLALWSTFYNDYAELVVNSTPDAEYQPLISYIHNNTAPDDTVLMWEAETAYNFASQRRSPTRYAYQYPLYRADYADKQKVTEFLNDIVTNKPRLIIVSSDGKLSDYHFGYRDYQVGGLMQHIKEQYSEPVPLGNWLIYTYIGP